MLTRNKSRVNRRTGIYNQENSQRQHQEKSPERKTSEEKRHVDGDTKEATELPPQTSTEQQKHLLRDAEFFLLCPNFEQQPQILVGDSSCQKKRRH